MTSPSYDCPKRTRRSRTCSRSPTVRPVLGQADAHRFQIGGRRVAQRHAAGGGDRGGAPDDIVEAVVRPTLELIIVEYPDHLQRRHDEKTGLLLLKP